MGQGQGRTVGNGGETVSSSETATTLPIASLPQRPKQSCTATERYRVDARLFEPVGPDDRIEPSIEEPSHWQLPAWRSVAASKAFCARCPASSSANR